MSAEPPGAGPADAEFLCGAYWLRYGQLPRYLSQLPEVIVVSPEYERYPQLGSLAGLLGMDVSAGPQLGAGVTRSALLDLFLAHVLRQWLEQHRDADQPEIYDQVVGAALREIHASPDRSWTVQQLSQLAGLSRTAFTKRFTAVVGKPPMEFAFGGAFRREYGISPGRFRQLDVPAPVSASHRNSALETKAEITVKPNGKN